MEFLKVPPYEEVLKGDALYADDMDHAERQRQLTSLACHHVANFMLDVSRSDGVLDTRFLQVIAARAMAVLRRFTQDDAQFAKVLNNLFEFVERAKDSPEFDAYEKLEDGHEH